MGGIAVGVLAAVIALTTTIAGTRSAEPGRVVAYPAPAGQALNTTFSVSARPAGGDWQALDVYRAVVDTDTFSKAGMALFDMDGPVEVAVTKTVGTMSSARIRPRSYAIPVTISADGKTASFVLPRPLDVSFEADGDILQNLHVFAGAMGEVPPAGPNVIAFGPGVHPIPGDHVLQVPSDTTVYIAGGAVVQGSIDIVGVRNVVVRGRGVIDPSRFFAPLSRSTVNIVGSKDIGIRGITLLRAQDGAVRIAGSSRVVISGIREINADRSSDGIYVNASTDVLVDGAFLRTSDDSIAIYATAPRSGRGDTRNVTVRNSTLWADRAHPFLAGVHGDPDTYDVIERVALQNVDILEHDEYRQGNLYLGALAINAGDRVTVRDVRFDDVRIEDFSRGQVVNLKVFRNPTYNRKAGWRIDRVLFRNVSYAGARDQQSEIRGYNRFRQVTNVTFENLVRNGRTVLRASAGNVEVGPYTANVVFRRQPSTRTVSGASAAIRYGGQWQRTTAAGSHDGDVHSPLRVGSTLKYAFVGRQARVYGLTGPGAGKVDVLLDGKLVAIVDTYSAAPRPRQIWFDTGVLTAGSHTLDLRYRRARNVLTTGASVAFDSLEIVK